MTSTACAREREGESGGLTERGGEREGEGERG